MRARQGRRDTPLLLAVAGVVGILTVAFAIAKRGSAAPAAEPRGALLEAVAVGMATVLYLGWWRRQWRRTIVALLLGAALLCWLAFAPDRLIAPSGGALLALAFIGVPVLTAFGVWRRIRR
jgi:hypothetical protein